MKMTKDVEIVAVKENAEAVTLEVSNFASNVYMRTKAH